MLNGNTPETSPIDTREADLGETGMVILSSSLSLMSINSTASRILGIPPESGRVFPLGKMWGAGSLGRADRLLKQVLNLGKTVDDARLTLIPAAGGQVPCRVLMLPLLDPGQKIAGVIVRFSVLPGIRKGRKHGLDFLPRIGYPRLFDELPQGVFSIDTDWRVRAFNKRAEQLTGYRREEIIGKYCWQVFQQGKCRHECPFTRIFDKGASCSKKELTILNPEGGSRRIRMETASLKDARNRVRGGIASFNRSSGRTIPLRVLETFQGMVGQSRAMTSIFDKLPDIAKSPVSVLITGESGTGKEMVARAVHNLSGRREMPFQAVNCSALPETLLESELFGHERGAFTGAAAAKPGRFELAAGGTFFLDEIGELKPALQVKLLRVLEQKEFERVGSDRTLKMTARIIAATHRNLEDGNGGFRQDLYFRLRTIPVHLPPLRERREDIPLLVAHFIKIFNEKYDKRVRLADPAVLSFFTTYDWPGNVRELARVMEYAFVFVKGPIIFSRYLPETPAFDPIRLSKRSGRPSEKERIARALEKTGQKRAKAAELLGISRSSLWRKMKLFGLSGQSPAEDLGPKQ